MSRAKRIVAFSLACGIAAGLLVYRVQPRPLTPDRARDAIMAWQGVTYADYAMGAGDSYQPVERVGEDGRNYYQISEFRCDLERRHVNYYHPVLKRPWTVYFAQDWLGRWYVRGNPVRSSGT